jgi:hypothetical protein
MPRFARLDENLTVIFSYIRNEAKQDGDIEIPKGYFLDAITFNKNEDDIIVVTRDTLREPESIKFEFQRIREQRNVFIQKTDYLATIDYPHATPEKKQEWLDYRQALRDLPSVTEDPLNPVWPLVPTA